MENRRLSLPIDYKQPGKRQFLGTLSSGTNRDIMLQKAGPSDPPMGTSAQKHSITVSIKAARIAKYPRTLLESSIGNHTKNATSRGIRDVNLIVQFSKAMWLI